ncbi:unnamed protein product, partial [Didymodactylos carnosus]
GSSEASRGSSAAPSSPGGSATIWDYGFLDEVTERKYIETILQTCDKLTHSPYYRMIVDAICISQKYLRWSEDISSVSLRDVARYRLLYNWFYESVSSRQPKLPVKDITFKSAILALLLCYYFRLSSKAEKLEYIDLIKKPMQFNDIQKYAIEDMLQAEQNDLIRRMELPPGTALNRALCDNIFVIFVCVLNRLPVILCGKPGCSKTSSVQIVITSLKGKKSNDPYFQELPELIAVAYQGSKNCRSESIEKVFERAKKYNDTKSHAKLLPVIIFDETGLAELSVHNPLKVLHSELEIGNCKYGFVAISNWRLDASKMNRTLYLACPDPTIDDLQLTAKTIQTSLVKRQQMQLPDDIMNNLAKAYLALSYELKLQKSENYFGLRDFYSLIKCIIKEFDHSARQESNIRYDNMLDLQMKIIRKQLKINFDGVIDGSVFLWKIFCQYTKQEESIEYYPSPNFSDLLTQSLNDRSGRYLMLISETNSLTDYVERYLGKKLNNVRTLIGSQISGDVDSESYGYRILMDVILASLYLVKKNTAASPWAPYMLQNAWSMTNSTVLC